MSERRLPGREYKLADVRIRTVIPVKYRLYSDGDYCRADTIPPDKAFRTDYIEVQVTDWSGDDPLWPLEVQHFLKKRSK